MEFAPMSFNVVILYEDFETGKQAKKTYDLLVKNLGRDCRCNNQMWKFDVLTIPKLRDIALKDAALADIVILSCHGEDLAQPIHDWLKAWVSTPTNALALVALFDCPPEQVGRVREVRAQLAELARQGDMEFFAQPAAEPSLREVPLFQNSSDWHSRTLSTLAGTVQEDWRVPRWGINE
jgi:hypothetical protein